MRGIGAIVSLLLVFAFFLPWFDMVIMTASGADLPSLFNQANSIIGDGGTVWYVYGLYLIPLFGVVNAALLFLDKSSKVFSFITSIIPLLYFALFYNNLSQWGGMSGSIMDMLKYGSYITLLSAVTLFLISIFLPSRHHMRGVS